ncbi:MAG: hypothetical protein H6732_18965 [Alphaproteobacteria bacterium]|nr:hypothetical protein [Alphaproteobacteria bacterium]
MTMAGGRARLTIVDLDGGREIVVQHDPRELRLRDGATWHARGQVERPGLEYERGRPATLSLTVVFDASRVAEDVDDLGVRDLRTLLDRVEVEEDGATVRRPPHLLVRWARWELTCVLTELDVAYRLFRADGRPVRAEVALEFTELEAPEATGEGAPPAQAPAGGGRRARPPWAVGPLPPWHGEGW